MGRPGGLLRYAGLEDERSATTRAREMRASETDDAFEAARHGDDSNEAARAPRAAGARGDGAKSLARIEQRLARRAARTELRDALDLLRQHELLENMALRRARTRQRTWFVLGRAVESLIEHDGQLRALLMTALDGLITRRDERRLVGLPTRNANEPEN